VFTIAANLARDEARAAIRRKQHLTLLAGGGVGAVEGSAADGAEERERADAVRRALDQLNERDREVLLLWDAGFDYTEIARQTGLKPGAIGTTLARARKRLVEAHQATSGVARTPQTKQG
jgi:RNA polymerase sigma factor (sigma-70 family)